MIPTVRIHECDSVSLNLTDSLGACGMWPLHNDAAYTLGDTDALSQSATGGPPSPYQAALTNKHRTAHLTSK